MFSQPLPLHRDDSPFDSCHKEVSSGFNTLGNDEGKIRNGSAANVQSTLVISIRNWYNFTSFLHGLIVMNETAVILTDDLLDEIDCKTAHGLILGNSRYCIVGVIDRRHAGQDAGLVISSEKKNIPVFSTVADAYKQLEQKPKYCIVGVAPIGGKFSETLVQSILEAISLGINVVSGLHSLLIDHPIIAPAAREKGVLLIDIRKPKPADQLPMWSGKIRLVNTPRIAVLGTDCAIGKRTTASLLMSLCQKQRINAEMIYTGQTGWLQNMVYGFILDSTLNDFVSGELEDAILRCVAEKNPELIFIEGQSALRNPSGPCGAELLLSAGAKYVVLQHSPARNYYTCDSTQTYKIGDLADEIALIRHYGAKVLAITLNSTDLPSERLQDIKRNIQETTQLPVFYPREEGVDALLPLLKNVIQLESRQ